MAADICYAYTRGRHSSMHPFFKPVFLKDDSPVLEPHINGPEDHPAPSTPEPSVNLGLSEPPSEIGELKNAHKDSGLLDVRSPRSIYEDSETLDVDPNLERRKRRKTTPFEDHKTNGSNTGQTGSQTPVNGKGSELASFGVEVKVGSTEGDPPNYVGSETVQHPPGSSGVSPVKLAIRNSPTKTPRKQLVIADTPAETPPTASRPVTRSGASPGQNILSPTSDAAPKRKVLKLTTKGKLLSSPPSISPLSNRKARGKGAKAVGKTLPGPRKATCISYGVDEDSRKRIGFQIDKILSSSVQSMGHIRGKVHEPARITHPFFLSKPAKNDKVDVVLIDDDSETGQESGTEERRQTAIVKPKDWNDLGFKKNTAKAPKVVDAIPPLWPPKDLQHLGVCKIQSIVQPLSIDFASRRGASKSKQESCTVSGDEDILERYALRLEKPCGQLRDAFPLPQKTVLSGQETMAIVSNNLSKSLDSYPGSGALQAAYPEAFARMQCKAASGISFAEAVVPGVAQSWLLNSAPLQTGHVLQAKSVLLREWLVSHQIHHTAKRLSTIPRVKTARKRRRKKKLGELDDFIASSEDEDDDGLVTLKNAVLIKGPHGCGKTASVYAVAKELDFEVFEIYPGMRRSAKDIFDKVGDMTQNHLVHRATQLDGERNSTPDWTASEPSSSDNIPGNRDATESLLGVKKEAMKRGRVSQARLGTLQSEVEQKSPNRKQSLILFEEVDILFEEDRGFWTGVIQLIEQSKRPAVLTCNDPASIPVKDLPLHTTLDYCHVDIEVATDYMVLLAAAEGHLLKREAVRSLFVSKEMDLRASISQLDFWCQMGVGSEKAGLDWIFERKFSVGPGDGTSETLRLLSKDTFTFGMGIVPQSLSTQSCINNGQTLEYAQQELGIPLQDWHVHAQHSGLASNTVEQITAVSRIEALQHNQELTDATSTLDVLNKLDYTSAEASDMRQSFMGVGLEVSITCALEPARRSISTSDIIAAHLTNKTISDDVARDLFSTAFKALRAPKPQFPVSLGRLAPSLDISSIGIVTDIAPYVRSIAHYDRRLEEQREALGGGSQGIKTRKTRAARAALEGGSKAETRAEKWFPKDTDYAAVLQTGGDWPLWPNDISDTRVHDKVTHYADSDDGNDSRSEAAANLPASDVAMGDLLEMV